MDIILTNEAPAAIGPYSQAVKHGDLIFCSGQIALNKTGEIAGETIDKQTHQVIHNLKAVLESAGSGIEKVIKTTIYLKSMADFAVVNEIYGQYFSHKPARATVEVARLPMDVLVEIDCIATT